MRFPNGVTRPPGFTWGPAAGAAPPSLAQLEAFTYNKKVYYKDPATGAHTSGACHVITG